MTRVSKVEVNELQETNIWIRQGYHTRLLRDMCHRTLYDGYLKLVTFSEKHPLNSEFGPTDRKDILIKIII